MGTNVPFPSFTNEGFVAPPEGEILAGVQADINTAFGGALNPALNTPQGQLATSLSAIIGNTDDLFCNLTQQVDPAYSSGRMQDGIARIYFLTRIPAQPTTLQLLCSGGNGVAIPVGALVIDDSDNLYAADVGGTIPIGGSVTLGFSCTFPGPTAVPSSVVIYRAIPGWDSASVTSGVQGTANESRAAFEARRAAAVEGNSLGSIGAVIGAVAKVTGVVDFYGYDNGLSTSATINGVTVGKNSIYVCVAGGTNADVAQAILSKKGPGSGYTGNTNVTAYDNNPLYAAPIPYSVTFQRPSDLPVLFAVSVINNADVPSDAAAQIKAALENAFAGADGGPRARIGSLVSALRFYSPLAALGSWAMIRSIQLGTLNTAVAKVTASIAGTVMTVSAVTSGTVAVGQTVQTAAGDIPPGTIIASLGTGSGGTGTYNLNVPVTLGSTTVYCVKPDQSSVQIQPDQLPTLYAADIAVTVS